MPAEEEDAPRSTEPKLDGYVLNHEQTVRMLEHAGWSDPVRRSLTGIPYTVQDRVVTPAADQRVVGDRNVKQVAAPMRVITVSAHEGRAFSWTQAVVLSMVATLFGMAGAYVRDYCTFDRPISHSTLSLVLYTCAFVLNAAFGVGCMQKPIRGKSFDSVMGWLWTSERVIHIHYIPHVLASLHKETSVLSSYDTEVTNVMMKIRRLAALPIPDRASVQLIDGTVKAYQAMLESRDFLDAALDDLLH